MTDTERRLAAAVWRGFASSPFVSLTERDAESIARTLLPVVAEIEAEARAEAITSMAHLFRDMAQETLARREVIQLLDLRADSYRVEGSTALEGAPDARNGPRGDATTEVGGRAHRDAARPGESRSCDSEGQP